jgi:hypothetical protein
MLSAKMGKIYRPYLYSLCSNSQNKYIKLKEEAGLSITREGKGL